MKEIGSFVDMGRTFSKRLIFDPTQQGPEKARNYEYRVSSHFSPIENKQMNPPGMLSVDSVIAFSIRDDIEGLAIGWEYINEAKPKMEVVAYYSFRSLIESEKDERPQPVTKVDEFGVRFDREHMEPGTLYEFTMGGERRAVSRLSDGTMEFYKVEPA